MIFDLFGKASNVIPLRENLEPEAMGWWKEKLLDWHSEP